MLLQNQYYQSLQQNLSNKYMSSTQQLHPSAQYQSKSQRSKKRFLTINTQTSLEEQDFHQNSYSLADSNNQRLPRKFRTQQNSPNNRRQSESGSLRFPQIFSRQNSESKNRLHLKNMHHIKIDGTKTKFFLDSLIRILKDGDQLPQVSSQREKKRIYPEDLNQFMEINHQRKVKKPKIMNNQITRTMLPATQKLRKIQSQEQQRIPNNGLINAISEKIGQNTLKYNKVHSTVLESNEFLPEGRDQLSKLRSFKFKKQNE